jgi:hypothetical protein
MKTSHNLLQLRECSPIVRLYALGFPLTRSSYRMGTTQKSNNRCICSRKNFAVLRPFELGNNFSISGFQSFSSRSDRKLNISSTLMPCFSSFSSTKPTIVGDHNPQSTVAFRELHPEAIPLFADPPDCYWRFTYKISNIHFLTMRFLSNLRILFDKPKLN